MLVWQAGGDQALMTLQKGYRYPQEAVDQATGILVSAVGDGYDWSRDPRTIAQDILDTFIEEKVVMLVDPDEPHQIELLEVGWVIQHPLACRVNGVLFDCPVNNAAVRVSESLKHYSQGRYYCHLDDVLGLVVDGPVET